MFQIIIVLFGVVGLGWGYTIQQFSQTVRMQLTVLGVSIVLIARRRINIDTLAPEPFVLHH